MRQSPEICSDDLQFPSNCPRSIPPQTEWRISDARHTRNVIYAASCMCNAACGTVAQCLCACNFVPRLIISRYQRDGARPSLRHIAHPDDLGFILYRVEFNSTRPLPLPGYYRIRLHKQRSWLDVGRVSGFSSPNITARGRRGIINTTFA